MEMLLKLPSQREEDRKTQQLNRSPLLLDPSLRRINEKNKLQLRLSLNQELFQERELPLLHCQPKQSSESLCWACARLLQ